MFFRSDRGAVGGGGLIEAIIVYGLGIVGLALLAGAGKMAWSALTGSSGSEVVMEIQSGVHQVTTIGNYGTGDLTTALVSARAVPSNIIVPGNMSELQGPTGTSFYTVAGNYSTFFHLSHGTFRCGVHEDRSADDFRKFVGGRLGERFGRNSACHDPDGPGGMFRRNRYHHMDLGLS